MSALVPLGALMVAIGAVQWRLRKPIGRANERLDRTLGGTGRTAQRWTEASYRITGTAVVAVGLVLLVVGLVEAWIQT